MPNNHRYWAYRIRLEKLKQKTWLLIVLAWVLLFLVESFVRLDQASGTA